MSKRIAMVYGVLAVLAFFFLVYVQINRSIVIDERKSTSTRASEKRRLDPPSLFQILDDARKGQKECFNMGDTALSCTGNCGLFSCSSTEHICRMNGTPNDLGCLPGDLTLDPRMINYYLSKNPRIADANARTACTSFGFKWFDRCGKCEDLMKDVNEVCVSSPKLTFLDSKSTYTNIFDCTTYGGVWAVDQPFPVSAPGICEACFAQGVSIHKGCAENQLGKTPKSVDEYIHKFVQTKDLNITGYVICGDFGYQWYDRCSICGANGLTANKVCKTNIFEDGKYAQYSNIKDCKTGVGAWNSDCKNCVSPITEIGIQCSQMTKPSSSGR